tara:strand:+ start:3773 stop:4246 length:474 start_codon:yes stop_codon:yes gene_type:complete
MNSLGMANNGGSSIELALVAVAAAVAKANEHGLKVSVAMVDQGGHLVAFARVEGTPWHSIDLAIDKARTSASFGLPSSTLGEMLDHACERVRMNLMMRPEIVAMGGALPVRNDGQLLGALGVSGASEEQDTLCAVAGCDALAEKINQNSTEDKIHVG